MSPGRRHGLIARQREVIAVPLPTNVNRPSRFGVSRRRGDTITRGIHRRGTGTGPTGRLRPGASRRSPSLTNATRREHTRIRRVVARGADRASASTVASRIAAPTQAVGTTLNGRSPRASRGPHVPADATATHVASGVRRRRGWPRVGSLPNDDTAIPVPGPLPRARSQGATGGTRALIPRPAHRASPKGRRAVEGPSESAANGQTTGGPLGDRPPQPEGLDLPIGPAKTPPASSAQPTRRPSAPGSGPQSRGSTARVQEPRGRPGGPGLDASPTTVPL